MTLQQLQYIVEISKCSSITAAAKKLFVAQPSLSKVVKDLEKEFHITILRRSRHGISFTADGLKFLHFANQVLDASANMQDYFLHEKGDGEKIRLSISSHHYLFAIDGMISFLQRQADTAAYTVRISEGRTSQIIHDVLVQRSQIGIIYISELTEQFMYRILAKNNLEFVPFCDFPPHAYLSKNHPLAGLPEISIEQPLPYPHICYEQGNDPSQLSEEYIIPKYYSRKTIYATDRSTMLSIIAHTNAYNLGTGCLLPRITGQDVVSIPISGAGGTMTIGWIKKKNMPLTNELTEYLHDLQNSLSAALGHTPFSARSPMPKKHMS